MTTPPAATGVGLGYGIAIAVMILILISTITLISYACLQVKGGAAAGYSGEPHIFMTESGRVLPPELTAVVVHVPILITDPKQVTTTLGESIRLPAVAAVKEGPCSICLAEYRPRDTVRCIPDCNHCFHTNCVDQWLRLSSTCPLCRNSPAPSPLPSPLSQLAPLAGAAYHIP